MKTEIKNAVTELKAEAKNWDDIDYESFVKHLDRIANEDQLCLSAHGDLMEWDEYLGQWCYVL